MALCHLPDLLLEKRHERASTMAQLVGRTQGHGEDQRFISICMVHGASHPLAHDTGAIERDARRAVNPRGSGTESPAMGVTEWLTSSSDISLTNNRGGKRFVVEKAL